MLIRLIPFNTFLILLIGLSNLHGVITQHNKDYFLKITNSSSSQELKKIQDMLKSASPQEKVMLLCAQDKYGNTPLHNAAFYGSIKIIDLLIDSGAQVNQQNLYGDTPLHNAAFYGNIKAVISLIKNGAHVNQQNNFGYTPLHNAVICKNFEIIKLLYEKKAALMIQNYNNQSPFDLLQVNKNAYGN